jgi:hypothetical protein
MKFSLKVRRLSKASGSKYCVEEGLLIFLTITDESRLCIKRTGTGLQNRCSFIDNGVAGGLSDVVYRYRLYALYLRLSACFTQASNISPETIIPLLPIFFGGVILLVFGGIFIKSAKLVIDRPFVSLLQSVVSIQVLFVV